MSWFKRKKRSNAFDEEYHSDLAKRIRRLEDTLNDVMGPRPRDGQWATHHVSVPWERLQSVKVRLEALRLDMNNEFRRMRE